MSQRKSSCSKRRRTRSRLLSTRDHAVLEVGQIHVVVARRLGPGDDAEVDGAAVTESRVWPWASLPGLEPRRLLPQLGNRHDRPSRNLEPGSWLEERRSENEVVAPGEVGRLVPLVRHPLLEDEAAVEAERPLEEERRAFAAHVAVERTVSLFASHGKSATSPWNGIVSPRYVVSSLVLGKSSCQPPA